MATKTTKTKNTVKKKNEPNTKEALKTVKSAKASVSKNDKTIKPNKDKYFEAVGRRKTSTARVRIWIDDSGVFVINDKDYKKFLTTEELMLVANAPLRKIKMLEKFKVSALVTGGGIRGQAEAIRHGIARALVEYDPELRLRLKKSGYLKRDPRSKERKKYGLKKARRAPQWSKR